MFIMFSGQILGKFGMYYEIFGSWDPDTLKRLDLFYKVSLPLKNKTRLTVFNIQNMPHLRSFKETVMYPEGHIKNFFMHTFSYFLLK